VHSSVEFSLDYMGLSTHRTGFRALEGSLEFDAAWPAASSVNAAIPVASVDETNDRLMSRLMDLDLLGGKDHPTINFKSTRDARPLRSSSNPESKTSTKTVWWPQRDTNPSVTREIRGIVRVRDMRAQRPRRS
jgi:hypothetical protein